MNDAFGVDRSDLVSKGVNYLKMPIKSVMPTGRNLNRSQALGMRRAQAAQGKKAGKAGVSIGEAKAAGQRAKTNRLDFVRRNPSAGSPKDQTAIYGNTLRSPGKKKLP